MDILTKEQRRMTMSRVRGKDTGLEIRVRKLIHKMGFRYRLQRKDLPGVPDISFPGLKKVIFIHGCFWHGHDCRQGMKRPKSNESYWLPKLDRNKLRDSLNLAKLNELGWKVLVVWECQAKKDENLSNIIKNFLME